MIGRPWRVVVRALPLTTALALAFTALDPAPLEAQGPTLEGRRSGVSRARTPRVADVPALAADPESAGAIGARLGVGTVGAVAGALIGAVVFHEILPHRSCGDDPGLCEAIIGYGIGGAVGAAVGTAMPAGTHACPRRRRFGYALLGAAPGALLAIGAGDVTAFLIAPLVSVFGATAAITTCAPASPATP